MEAMALASRKEEGMERTRQQEIQRNYEAFKRLLPSLAVTHPGKFALMRHGEVVEIFDTAADAYRAGAKMFEDGMFSVQEVIETPVDLGFFSHAVPRH